jgi:D-alanyl-D-alanine carboxypeptidase
MSLSQSARRARTWTAASAAIALAVMLSSCAPADNGPATAALEAALSAELEAIRSDAGIAGMTAAIVMADGRLIQVSAGKADVEANIAMRPDQLMPAGSIGKTFVAATALKLVEDGVLDLDTPIARWVGSREWFQGVPNGDAVTLRMLLNHSSGINANYIPHDAILPMFERTFGPDGISMADQGFRYTDLGAVIASTTADFPAGQGFRYSDSNYILAGLLIEDVTGQAFYDAAVRLFIEPLGLRHTMPTPRFSRDYAAGYEPAANSFPGFPAKVLADGRLFYDPALEWAGGGFASTSGDLAVWAGQLYGRHAISGAMVDAMIASANPHVPEQAGWGYGLAVQILEDEAGQRLMHGGYIPGYSSYLEFRPATNMSIALQMNARVGFGANRAAADRLWAAAAAAMTKP